MSEPRMSRSIGPLSGCYANYSTKYFNACFYERIGFVCNVGNLGRPMHVYKIITIWTVTIFTLPTPPPLPRSKNVYQRVG